MHFETKIARALGLCILTYICFVTSCSNSTIYLFKSMILRLKGYVINVLRLSEIKYSLKKDFLRFPLWSEKRNDNTDRSPDSKFLKC